MFTVRYESNIHDAIAASPVDLFAAWRAFTQAQVHKIAEELSSRLAHLTPYPSIAQGFGVKDRMPTGFTVESDIINSKAIWKFREFDMKGGSPTGWWPPYSAGSRLFVWAQAKGISARYVASVIHQRGIVGNKIIQNSMAADEAHIRTALELGQHEFFLSALGFGGGSVPK